MAAELLNDSLDFLVDLFQSEARLRPAPTFRTTVEEMGIAFGGELQGALQKVARWVRTVLADVPRGVTHGDFFHGNMLISADGRLSGVVDWDSALGQDLPLLDLLHLEATSQKARGALAWGPTVASRLLPQARAGGNSLERRYCARIGLKPNSSLLEALVIAYWLRRLTYQVGGYADRTARPLWIQRNMYDVLAAIDV